MSIAEEVEQGYFPGLARSTRTHCQTRDIWKHEVAGGTRWCVYYDWYECYFLGIWSASSSRTISRRGCLRIRTSPSLRVEGNLEIIVLCAFSDSVTLQMALSRNLFTISEETIGELSSPLSGAPNRSKVNWSACCLPNTPRSQPSSVNFRATSSSAHQILSVSDI